MSSPKPRSSQILRIGSVEKAELQNQLRKAGVCLNALAVQLFDHDGFQTTVEQRTLKVIQVSVAQLGFEQGGTFEQVTANALALGYSLCPLELGPHYRLALADQEEDCLGRTPSQNCAPPGAVTVASQAISEDDDVPKGFYLRVIEGVPWLRGYRSWPGHIWSQNDVFAFAEGPSAT